jgi:hypothetical protein
MAHIQPRKRGSRAYGPGPIVFVRLRRPRGKAVAGSGRARRFRQARELKQGGREQVCSFCHANLTLGEVHDPECDYAAKEEDPWAVSDEEDAEDEEEEAW